MVEVYEDPRHAYLDRIGRELFQRLNTPVAPELIYDWLKLAIEKIAPADNSGAIMEWHPSFEIYDQEIARRIALSQLPENERKMFSWPWQSWNNLIDPIEAGILVVLAGPDGAGKTTYAENIAEYWARRGQQVVFVHFELSKFIMLDRRAVRHTAIARRQLKLAGELTTRELADLEEAKRRLLAWPGGITYLHTPGQSIELVVRELARLQAEGKCDVAVIDYLEKAAPSNTQLKAFGANQFQREANDVELLKNYSESAGIPSLLLSQFNKFGKSKDFKDLDRGDIRGAGEKTEKANVVILLQPDKQNGNVMNVKLDKNTMGPKGIFQQGVVFSQYQVRDLA
jgi:replicative DNA helicase